MRMTEDGGAPEHMYHIEQRGVERFLWAKNMEAKNFTPQVSRDL
jgi:hypothetical protein